MLKKIFLGLLTVFCLIQIFQIDKNNPAYDSKQDLLSLTQPPAEIADLLKSACYDCHSNQTIYPWYSYIQPVGWFLQNHVRVGRGEFNFSEWATYSPEDRGQILHECAEEVLEGEMPLTSYTLTHADARLTDTQRKNLADWFESGSGERRSGHNYEAEEHE